MPAKRKPAADRKPQPHRGDAVSFLVSLPAEQAERLDALLDETGEARVSFVRRAIRKLLKLEAEK